MIFISIIHDIDHKKDIVEDCTHHSLYHIRPRASRMYEGPGENRKSLTVATNVTTQIKQKK